MTMLATVAVVLAGLLLASGGVWLVSLLRRDAGIADVFWGVGFALVAWACCAFDGAYDARDLLLAILTSIWGFRLAGHILRRNWGKEEDRRYQAMRDHHGERFWWVSLFTVFVLQAGLLWFVALPLQVAILLDDPPQLFWLDGIGAAVWGVGLFFESVGDWQLARFKSRPENAGRVMDRGLWRYTRHPNYFGDFCVWWGLYLIAAAGGAWWTILSPIAMSFLLLRVSGVTLLESDMAERRPEYRDYQARTNAFFPGPPRRG
jgi:steroid 5-alpha reductase family enzyme